METPTLENLMGIDRGLFLFHRENRAPMMSMVSYSFSRENIGAPLAYFHENSPTHFGIHKPSFVGVAGMVHHRVPLGVVLCHDMRWRRDGHVDVVILAEENVRT